MNSATTLKRAELHKTFTTMERHGGGFVARLAQAWYVADPMNKDRIERTFTDLLAKYGPTSRFYNQ